MTRSFHSTDSPNHIGETNTWLTPKWLIDALGPFDLDPCAAPSPRPWATATKMNELPSDGLAMDWVGRVFLNPPYGKFVPIWLRRLANHGKGCALLFARTDTAWFHEGYRLADSVFLLEKRIRFCRQDGSIASSAGTGSALFLFGEDDVMSARRAQERQQIRGIFI
jgi:hypothetical protein